MLQDMCSVFGSRCHGNGMQKSEWLKEKQKFLFIPDFLLEKASMKRHVFCLRLPLSWQRDAEEQMVGGETKILFIPDFLFVKASGKGLLEPLIGEQYSESQ
ncbi:hypothetical protein CDAR_84141 [Caerostris darwini]|uniref:Uncharacterized protein n=1 Tax=Caerostris darwini TaxID=1538125 RepID=A0AAV4U6A1_9ARAC|nr:hypothetical protein CDAR_84141 [Caerostris darwini]